MGQQKRYFFLLLGCLLITSILGIARQGYTQEPVSGQVGPTNPIAIENRRQGTGAWRSPNFDRYFDDHRRLFGGRGYEHANGPNSLDVQAAWTDPQIVRGYASRASINAGESITFQISSRYSRYDLYIYRMGWYNGSGGRLLRSVPGLPGTDYPIPNPDPTTGLIEANWPVAYTLQTDATWTTGFYLVQLREASNLNGTVSYIPFVIRDDSSDADILYQVPFTTYQAYNAWGGKSLYDYNSTGGRASHVSFDRPYEHDDGAGLFFAGDYNMIRWLESQGYDIAYATSQDMEANSRLLDNHKVFLSNFHDEYWSWTMRTNVQAARDRGVDLAFFDSNNVYFQIRYQPSAAGVPNRRIICYKNAATDPMSSTTPRLTTVRFNDPPVNAPENALLGVLFQNAFGYGDHYPWVVLNADHWVYAGTGLTNGAMIDKLVGYEYDRVANNGLTPPDLVTLSHSPIAIDGSYSNATIYTAPSGAMVFAASTNYWAYMLDGNWIWPRDSRVQRMTQNILNRMINGTTTVATPTLMATATPTVEATHTPTTTRTMTVTTTPGVGGAQGLTGGYYNGMNFETFVLSRTDSTVNFNWGASSPAVGVNADGFSVRWTGYVTPRYTESYTFYTRTGDGVRLWVNGRQLLNAWWTQEVTERSASIALTSGQPVAITMEFFEKAYDASAQLFWSSSRQSKEIVPASQLSTGGGTLTPTRSPTSGMSSTPTMTRTSTAMFTTTATATVTPNQGLTGSYYNGMNFETFVLSRTDSTVNFNWGASSPAPGVNADGFSVRWTGYVTPRYTESYTFYTRTGDGVRLWVNGRQLLNAWWAQEVTERSASIALTSGQPVAITMEFFEKAYDASAQLFWSSSRQSKEIVPATQLSTTASPLTVDQPTHDAPPAEVSLQIISANATVPEGGSATAFALHLTSAPAVGEVVVIDVTHDSQFMAVVPSQFIFTADNWNSDQYGRIQAARDNLNEGAHSGQIMFTVNSATTATLFGATSHILTIHLFDDSVIAIPTLLPPSDNVEGSVGSE